jgi:hypothetical protein
MQLINTTWPHPGHVYINAGMSAAGTKQFVGELAGGQYWGGAE